MGPRIACGREQYRPPPSGLLTLRLDEPFCSSHQFQMGTFTESSLCSFGFQFYGKQLTQNLALISGVQLTTWFVGPLGSDHRNTSS